MARWKIEYWNPGRTISPVAKWLDKLTDDQLEAITKELSLLEEIGNRLKLPHSRALSNGLFELRERHYGLRIYYGFQGAHIIILLAAGNKKSQKKDIEIARERLAECE